MAVEFGRFALDLARCELRRDGRVVPVQRKVFDLLAYLVEHPDRLVSRQELLERVWQGTVVSPISINRTVTQARQVLEDRGTAPRWIATVHGRGYRFVGELRPDEPGPVQCKAGSTSVETSALGLGALSEKARRALEVASVLGLRFSARLLATLLDEPDARVAAALDEAVRAGLLVLSRGESFDHAFVAPHLRDALHGSLPAERASALHWRAAVSMEADRPRAADAEQIAEHYLACASAEGRERAMHYFLRAGNQAAERHQHDTALRFYRRALDLRASVAPQRGDEYPLRCDLLLRIAHQTLQAGRSFEAAEIGSAAVDDARGLQDPARMVEATLGLWSIFDAEPAALDVTRVRRLLEDALSMCTPDALLARARLHACLGVARALDGQPRSVERARGRAEAPAEAPEDAAG